MLDCSSLRPLFPALHGGLVFLDSAASTLKPRPVLDAMHEFALNKYANVHRGSYRLSVEATEAYEEAHRIVERFIGAREGEVVFTGNTTSSMHLAALLSLWNGVIKPGSRVVVPLDAHHSTLLPWARAAERAGASLSLVPVDGEGVPRWEVLDELLGEGDVSVVVVTHVSNVTGYESPVREIAARAKRQGALVVVDSAQGVPHLPVNVNHLGADMIAFSGHKMLGPTGIGVLWIRRELAESLEPPLGGGGTVEEVRVEGGRLLVEWEEPPLKFESGTPPIIEAVGLAAAVEILEGLGMEEVARHEAELVRMLMEELTMLRGVELVGPRDAWRRRGIVSFTVRGWEPGMIGAMLGVRNIAVRAGRHCAHPLHHALGRPEGSVRVSFYIYNCPGDVEALVSALREILGA